MKILAAYVATALAALIFCNDPAVVGGVNNTDLLLPAAYIQDLLHHTSAALLFQLPRTPSLVPDLTIQLILRLLLGNWRLVNLVYAVLAFTTATALIGAVISRAARIPRTPATLWASAATIAAMALDLACLGPTHPLTLIFAPAVHSGSLLLAFAGFLLVSARLTSPSLTNPSLTNPSLTNPSLTSSFYPLDAAIALLSLLAVLSDRVFVGSFTLPALAALTAMALIREIPWTQAGRIGLVLIVGCAAGIQADKLLFAHALLREPDVPLDWHPFLPHLALLLRSPTLPLILAAQSASIALAVFVAWRRATGVFWVVACTAATTGHLILWTNLYTDDATTRYIQPVFWWAILWSAAAAATLTTRRAALDPAAALTALAAAILPAIPHLAAKPAFLAWDDPIAACLRPLAASGTIHAGIADYWTARPIEAATNWALQVDPIDHEGRIYQWGNNRTWFDHARHDPANPPRTDFIVLANLDQPAIQDRFGPPASVIHCPGSDIWTYPASIHHAIGGIATAGTRDGILRHDACFYPRDFKPPALEPVQPSAISRGPWQESTTQGPGTGLQKGRWTLTLHYTLKGGDGRWELFGNRDKSYATALLPDTNGQPATITIDADLPRNVQGTYLRTYAAPKGTFKLDHLAIQLPGSPKDPCQP